MQREMPGHGLRPRTPGALCTRPAVLASNRHRDLGTPGVRDLRGPRTRPLPLRTAPPGVLPVDGKRRQALGPLPVRLPTAMRPRGPPQIPPLILTAADE